MYNALKNGETTQEHLFDFKEVAEVNLVELHLIIILGMRLENAEINDEKRRSASSFGQDGISRFPRLAKRGEAQ